MELKFEIPTLLSRDYSDHQKALKAEGYRDSFIIAAHRHQIAIELQSNESTGQAILEYCFQRGYTKQLLTFNEWYDGNIFASNHNDVLHVVIGSWWIKSYVLRGIVKRKRPHGRFRWLLNGQASTGTTQVVHIAENDRVPFPQLRAIGIEWETALRHPKWWEGGGNLVYWVEDQAVKYGITLEASSSLKLIESQKIKRTLQYSEVYDSRVLAESVLDHVND